MLQNRVDPSGNIIRTAARGSWTGNRGVLHDEHQQIVRSFRLKAWITCRLEFKGRWRKVMTPNRWTELFFLDEATSFAAGHRPCFECRREDAVRFKSFWLAGNPEYGFDQRTAIREIDEILHKERLDRDGSKILFEEKTGILPDGVFVLFRNDPWLVMDGSMWLWSPVGYEKQIPLPGAGEKLRVLTPRSVMNALRAGYAAQTAVNPHRRH
jgi:hypothetical protein